MTIMGPTTLWAFTARYKYSFTFLLTFFIIIIIKVFMGKRDMWILEDLNEAKGREHKCYKTVLHLQPMGFYNTVNPR
jgi:hypothetical protein